MNKIHDRLTSDLDYRMVDILAIDGVLHSLPPATRNLSQADVMQENRSPSMNSG